MLDCGQVPGDQGRPAQPGQGVHPRQYRAARLRLTASPWQAEDGVRTAGFRLQASDFRLQTSGFRLQASDFRLQTSGFRLPASGSGRMLDWLRNIRKGTGLRNAAPALGAPNGEVWGLPLGPLTGKSGVLLHGR
jgi:hypothetical protein